MSLDLFWDANGNLSQSIDCNTGGAQLNFWDEENRLRMTVNPKHAGYYGYDASGERVYKLTGHTQYDDMNGSNPLFGIIFDRLTLYPSPYIVLSEKQYTKHFYAGTEKIATLIGDGGLLLKEGSLEPEHIGRLKEGFYQSFHIDPSQFNYTKNVDIQDKAIDEVQYQCKYIEQVDIKLDSIYPMLKPMMHYWENVYGNNNDIFYTHANHLGSASWITDQNGKPIQYIHYAPYGELIANQCPYGYDERFKFTGKERDGESGYDFFGARYYDSRKGFWNSVDPLADKYPNVTPYLYCGGNPVMLVDPDGRRVVANSEGEIVEILDDGDDKLYKAPDGWNVGGSVEELQEICKIEGIPYKTFEYIREKGYNLGLDNIRTEAKVTFGMQVALSTDVLKSGCLKKMTKYLRAGFSARVASWDVLILQLSNGQLCLEGFWDKDEHPVTNSLGISLWGLPIECGQTFVPFFNDYGGYKDYSEYESILGFTTISYGKSSSQELIWSQAWSVLLGLETSIHIPLTSHSH